MVIDPPLKSLTANKLLRHEVLSGDDPGEVITDERALRHAQRARHLTIHLKVEVDELLAASAQHDDRQHQPGVGTAAQRKMQPSPGL